MDRYQDTWLSDQAQQVLQRGGEMGRLISVHNWSSSLLGPMNIWPGSLITTLGIVLNSVFPVILLWGKDLICFYNDAYKPSLEGRGKHPALGKPAEVVWAEVWKSARPVIDGVLTTGKPTWFEDRLMRMLRGNKWEDVYWTFSHSPVLDDNGNIGGVLITSIETTRNVLDKKKYRERSGRAHA